MSRAQKEKATELFHIIPKKAKELVACSVSSVSLAVLYAIQTSIVFTGLPVSEKLRGLQAKRYALTNDLAYRFGHAAHT